MPQKSKRRSQSAAAIKSRWAKKNVDLLDDGFVPDIPTDLHDSNENNKENNCLKNKMSVLDIGNLFEALSEETSIRPLSVLVYLSSVNFGIPWRDIDLFLKAIGGLTAKTCNKWSTDIIEQDLEEFLQDNRGGKDEESFYDTYPELENLAKLYALNGCKRKSASFTCSELASYVDDEYYKLTGETKTTKELIRPERGCCRDMNRWGCKFDKIHDESCFRSGETAAKRWFYSDDTISFFNKGRGRSLMVSDFLIAHPENPFFQLSQDEWAAAVKKHPELLEDDAIQYIERSASGSIQVGYGGYFDKDAIINRFTRLFKMLPLKKAYANHKFHVIADSARTHSAKQYSVEDFGMKPGTRCSTEKIFYRDKHGKALTIDCFFTTGVNKGQSKGLLNLAKELDIDIPQKVKLEELKRLLNLHEAFKNVSIPRMMISNYM
ncbi:unnamed protein product [Adineta ricciae]|uniref:Uncharacterized protein n=1 Tax=Adineta ricciae TaxID=249248 RepID=A0A816AHU1_ADIRI|nr:unnamed protein product [Adineta ricciae]